MQLHYPRHLILCGLVLLLSACSGTTELEDDETASLDDRQTDNVPATVGADDGAIAVEDPHSAWDQHQDALLQVESWSVFGKLGLRSATDSFTATLQWRQVGDDYRIRLSGPFGAGALQIEGDEQGVTLRTGEGQEYAAGSPEELLYQHLGWSVPLSGLRYWMLGRTQPEQEVSNLAIDDAGRAKQFAQAHWLIDYQSYRNVGELSLPRKASLTSNRVVANVLVTRWQVSTPIASSGDTVAEADSRTDLAAASEGQEAAAFDDKSTGDRVATADSTEVPEVEDKSGAPTSDSDAAAPTDDEQDEQQLVEEDTQADTLGNTEGGAESMTGDAQNEDQSGTEEHQAAQQSVGDETDDLGNDTVTGTEPDARTPQGRWRDRRSAVLELETWQMLGKVSIQRDTHIWTSALNWGQHSDDYEIRFSAPLAAGGFEVAGNRRSAELRTSSYESYRARSAEKLIDEYLGLSLPLSKLRYWLLGRTDPDGSVDQVFIDEHGQVLYFDQSGWRVEFEDYRDTVGLSLPGRVRLRSGNNQVSIVVTEWHL